MQKGNDIINAQTEKNSVRIIIFEECINEF